MTEPASVAVLERAGVDIVVNPRMVTAEEIVRFAHDPRIRQMAMLEETGSRSSTSPSARTRN